MGEKRYKIIHNASEARRIMKLGHCFPIDIKKNRNPREQDKPSVFIFENVDEKDFKVICSPARARTLLKEGFKMVDIKENARPKESDSPTIFIFEVTKEFIQDFSQICEEEI